ncbi:hypothetical protein ABZ690_08680, partial [Streptomyces sp. NPDC006967]|uniref:hypothetical protein n=1 Tax=Streptomyces sp. NPDC006967 TaxID=3156906 RepID=UPI0033F22F83
MPGRARRVSAGARSLSLPVGGYRRGGLPQGPYEGASRGALPHVVDRKLYRADYGTFEEYAEKRWQMSRRRAYQMI